MNFAVVSQIVAFAANCVVLGVFAFVATMFLIGSLSDRRSRHRKRF